MSRRLGGRRASLARRRDAHECALVEADARAQQVGFQHRLARQAGVARKLRLQLIDTLHAFPRVSRIRLD